MVILIGISPGGNQTLHSVLAMAWRKILPAETAVLLHVVCVTCGSVNKITYIILLHVVCVTCGSVNKITFIILLHAVCNMW